MTADDIKYVRLARGLENAYMTLADLEARPYTRLNEHLISRWKDTVAFRRYKLDSFLAHREKRRNG